MPTPNMGSRFPLDQDRVRADALEIVDFDSFEEDVPDDLAMIELIIDLFDGDRSDEAVIIEYIENMPPGLLSRLPVLRTLNIGFDKAALAMLRRYPAFLTDRNFVKECFLVPRSATYFSL